MADASVVLKLLDQISPGLSAVRRATDQTGKSFDELAGKVSALRTKNEGLNKEYAALQTQLVDAKKAVQEATKAYKESGDEVSRTNLQKAQEQYKDLTDQMTAYKSASADTRKEIRELQNEMRKLEEGGGYSFGGSEALTGIGVAFSGMAKQFGSAVTGAGSYLLNSALGSTDAGVVTSVLGGAASGAAAGLVAGPVGAVIGGIVGGVSGLIEGMTAQAEAEDEAFRSYRDDLISSISQNDAAALSSGVSTAAQREQDQIAFSALLGDSAVSRVLLNSVKELSNITPYVYDDLTGIARQLAIFDATSEDLYDNLVRIGDAGSALGMSASTMEGLAQVLGKIGDSEKYEATYTRSLRNYGINPASVFAEYFGITQAEANEVMNAGTKEERVRELIGTDKLTGADAMEAILSVLGSRYGGMMERQASTYAGALSTRQGLEAELQNYMGEAYTGSRALAEHNVWMQNFYQSEAYSAIGRAMAYKENLEDAIYRDVMGGVFAGETITTADEETASQIIQLREEYLAQQRELADAQEAGDEQRAMETGAKISEIYDRAQALVLSAQDADARFDAWDEAAESLVHDVGSIVAVLDAYKDSWALSKAKERGPASMTTVGELLSGNASVDDVVPGEWYESPLLAEIMEINRNPLSAASISALGGLLGYRSAVGKSVIPYDDFPLLAHEGERLLTASEAREYRAGGGTPINITGNNFYVRKESDIDAIAREIARQIRAAEMAII